MVHDKGSVFLQLRPVLVQVAPEIFRFYADKSAQTGSYLVVGQGRENSTAPWLITAGDSQGQGLQAPQESSKIAPTVSLLRLGVDFKDLQPRLSDSTA